MLSIPSLLGGGWYLLSFISMFILNMEVPKRGTLYFVCVKTKKKKSNQTWYIRSFVCAKQKTTTDIGNSADQSLLSPY